MASPVSPAGADSYGGWRYPENCGSQPLLAILAIE